MIIRNLVLSGGGPSGFLTYGASKYLNKIGFWELANIKSIYGTSIGAFLGVLFSLNLDWNYLDNYLINNNWEEVLDLKPRSFIDAYSSKGIVNEHFIKDAMYPLFDEINLDHNINLQDFYNYNNIDLHLYTTEMNGYKFEKIDLSYKTHPKLKVIEAVEMSTAFPIIFRPILKNNKCYIDGGLINNLPLNDCLKQTKSKKNDLLVYKNCWANDKIIINKKSSIIDFILVFILKLIEEVDTEDEQITVPNTVIFKMAELEDFNKGQYNSWIKCIKDKKNRKYLISKGEYYAKQMLRNKN